MYSGSAISLKSYVQEMKRNLRYMIIALLFISKEVVLKKSI